MAKVDNMVAMLEEFKGKLVECWADVNKEEKKDETS